jgi:3-hydroxybutyrate dehydrogenase
VHDLSEEDVLARVMLQNSAIKRLIEPDEVAAAAAYLCSDDAAFMTGTNLVLDGGWSAR